MVQPQNVDDLVRRLRTKEKKDASKELTQFYANARFRPSKDVFARQYTDGANDGGIDFWYIEDSTYYIFQSKFSGAPRKTDAAEISDELRKLKNTISGENPNSRAADFVNALRRDASNSGALLEVVWLTTNQVSTSVRDSAQRELEAWRRKQKYALTIDFVAIDKPALDSVIYDVRHGYIPYTGKKTVKVHLGQMLEASHERTGIQGLICTVNVNQLLGWFHSSDDINRYLQKNVRDFQGDTKVNRGIAKSYLDAPPLFWYKHNGIIVFVDNLVVDESGPKLALRNPQIVNGGQTIKALFGAFEKDKKAGEEAAILLRVYRLPFEDSETYRKSIDIISALNTQNKIEASDLRSTDPRQVRIERLFSDLNWVYQRKKEKGKPGTYTIRMRDLAIVYYVCKKQLPRDALRTGAEKLFEEDSRYDEVFSENAINAPMKDAHVVMEYLTCWTLYQQLRGMTLPHRDRDYAKYTRWLVLADTYNRLVAWKRAEFRRGWRDWMDFMECEGFRRAVCAHARGAFTIGRTIVPAGQEQSEYYKSADAYRRFEQRLGGRTFKGAFKKALRQFEHGQGAAG